MGVDRLLGIPWWLLALLAVAAVLAVAFAGRAMGHMRERAEKRQQAESLAQAADAEHEGARTKHEGGA